MSLNRKRRIFRSDVRLRPVLPAVGLALAGGVAALILASVSVRPADAPAGPPASSQVSAAADQLMVLDGATLRMGEQVVRLEGIVAPARGSQCRGADGAMVDCGSAAANALATLVHGRSTACTIHGHDALGRPVGECAAGGQKLGVALVADGWARADAAALRQPEADARAAGRGIWSGGS